MRAVIESYWRHRFAALFVILVATVVAKPLFEPLTTPRIIDVFLAITLFTLVLGVGRRQALVATAFASVFVMLHEFREIFGDTTVVSLTTLVWVLGCFAGLIATLSHVLRPGVVDDERIFAALDVYLLAALIFGVLYYALERLHPGSFDSTEGIPFNEFRAIYFSFVTIATLGYGDVVPKSEVACTLAVVEAVSGQMYLAVMLARLVSLYGKSESA